MNSNIDEIKGVSKKDFFESKGYIFEEVEAILRLDRQYKAQVNSREDEHHIVAVSKNGSNHPLNRKKIQRGEHVRWHDTFGVRLPHEQIKQVTLFNSPVLLPKIIDRIEDILSETQRNKLYKSQAFIS